MSWLTALFSGAAGGFIVSAVAFFNDIWAWHEERRRYLRTRLPHMPRLAQFTDVKADPLVLLTRMALGGLVGFLVRDEVTGVLPLIAAGASAHAILSQFGKNQTYIPGIEVGTADQPGERTVTTRSDNQEDSPDGTSPQTATSYRPRHAKGDLPSAPNPAHVPRPRVQPDRSQLSPTEPER